MHLHFGRKFNPAITSANQPFTSSSFTLMSGCHVFLQRDVHLTVSTFEMKLKSKDSIPSNEHKFIVAPIITYPLYKMLTIVVLYHSYQNEAMDGYIDR